MKSVVLAYSNIGCTGIKALMRQGVEIIAVFTHRDNPDENIWFDSVAELATSEGIPVYAPEDINHPLWVNRIRKMAPDVIFSFYYRNMIKEPLLDIPPRGCINLHGSLLPAYRGRCPVNWAIINGEKESGVTLHYMTPHPDDGDIIAAERVEIDNDDTAAVLHDKLRIASGELLDKTIPEIIRGTAPRLPQDAAKSSYYGGRCAADGKINWSASAKEIYDLVRAVTHPYPGAFSYAGSRKITIWKAEYISFDNRDDLKAGSIAALNPLTIVCGSGALIIRLAQAEDGITVSGEQLADDLCLAENMVFNGCTPGYVEGVGHLKSVLIMGVNGFIGNALTERLLDSGKYEVHGMDLYTDNIGGLLERPGFKFSEGDISIHREWIEYHIKKCDIILPLVAIATPIEYSRNPLRVFELDFEENLRVVRYCAKYGKRIIFPSTSEVYGMCGDESFKEDSSRLVLGPINKQRWIYSCSKQLLDRVIWAYGQTCGLQFSLFRPFNWVGPKLDRLDSARIGSSRAITQLILNLVEGTPIQLVDGGGQKRCFTDISEGIECLFRIIENPGGVCDSQIINIGNPENEASIAELAQILVDEFNKHPLRSEFPPFAGFRQIESASYYGEGYEDVDRRKPDITKARRLLGWNPRIGLDVSVRQTLDYFLKDALENRGA